MFYLNWTWYNKNPSYKSFIVVLSADGNEIIIFTMIGLKYLSYLYFNKISKPFFLSSYNVLIATHFHSLFKSLLRTKMSALFLVKVTHWHIFRATIWPIMKYTSRVKVTQFSDKSKTWKVSQFDRIFFFLCGRCILFFTPRNNILLVNSGWNIFYYIPAWEVLFLFN